MCNYIMSIQDILGVLRIALTDDMDSRYLKYLKKEIENDIEFVEPITLILIPETIYVCTKKDKNELLSTLLKSISDEYDKQELKNSKNDSIGHIIGTSDKLEVFSVVATASTREHKIDINVSGQKHYFIEIIDTFTEDANKSVFINID